MATSLEEYLERKISVITNDGRCLLGICKGIDKTTNIVLIDAVERVYSADEGVQQVPIGLYVVRGDNTAVVGLVNEAHDNTIDYSAITADELKPVVH